MILLLGGTSETARIATALAEAGMDVLVSTAEKLQAARRQKCNIVVVNRPAAQLGPVATTIPQLLARLNDYLCKLGQAGSPWTVGNE